MSLKHRIKYLKRKWGPTKNPTDGFRLYGLPLLASYPRSGTNWVSYAAEQISGKPLPIRSRYPRFYFENRYVMDRAHNAYPIMHRHKKVILIIRNYRECLLRHHKHLWLRANNVERFLSEQYVRWPPSLYIKNIEAFDSLTCPKLLLYYEDVISEPKKHLPRITEFLELSQVATSEFIDNIDHHEMASKKDYRSRGHQTESSRKKNIRHKENILNFHTLNKLSHQQKQGFDRFYQDNYPDLYQKYLMRYGAP